MTKKGRKRNKARKKVVVFISALIAIIPVALKLHDQRFWFHLALVFLVNACPCAIVLSTPVVTFCALTKAASAGVLIKGGDYLELLAKLKTVAFDKTGTITKGEFSVTQFQSLNPDINFHSLLHWVVSIESKSSHPVASALVNYGRTNSIKPEPEKVEKFEFYPGEGVYGEIDGKKIYVGNRRIAARVGSHTAIEEFKEGVTVIHVFLDTTAIGIFCLSDTCRSGVAEAIRELKSLGIKTAMLTGDSNVSAMHVQYQLNEAFEVVHAELLPQDKVKILKEFKAKGAISMVGDGINDAPALAMADVGISMGIAGSGVANETGHITLMSNDLGKIPMIIKLALQSRMKIIQNIIILFTTKMAVLGLALSGHPLLWAAVLADVGTCLLVIFNSMSILHGSGRSESKCRRTSVDPCYRKDGKSCRGHESYEHEGHQSVQQNCCSRFHKEEFGSKIMMENQNENHEHCSITMPLLVNDDI